MVDPRDFSAPFDGQIGLHYIEVTPDGARAQLEITPKLLQPMGLVHGGVYCSMIESMASVSAYTWLSTREGGNVVGVNNNTDFLRSIGAGTVYGNSEPIHRGRRQQLWLVTITDAGRDRVQTEMKNIHERLEFVFSEMGETDTMAFIQLAGQFFRLMQKHTQFDKE